MEIVDKKKICEVFSISERSLQDQWKSWPHFFVCKGRDLRSARFNLEKVVEYLENANKRQTGRYLDSKYPEKGIPKARKKRVPDKNRRQGVGASRMGKDDNPGGDRFNLLAGLH